MVGSVLITLPLEGLLEKVSNISSGVAKWGHRDQQADQEKCDANGS
ncbi:MAG: hypothetical protein U0165_11305 [Polyangiaceae bacterium]